VNRYHILGLAVALSCSALVVDAKTVTYDIDPNHTFPRYQYSHHFGLSTQLGRFDATHGIIVLDRTAHTGSIDISIDTASVDSGSHELDEDLKSDEFLDAKKYPTITFRSSALQFTGNRLTAVDGDLTIKGVTKPVTLKVTSFRCMPHPMLKREACGANATATIKRSEFNAGKYVPLVGDDLTLTIAVEAIAK